MFIPDCKIAEMCENAERPLVRPFYPEFLGPASLDLHLASRFASPKPIEAFIYKNGHLYKPHPDSFSTEIRALPANQDHNIEVEIVLQPQQVILCHSQEYVMIPNDLVGDLSMRSSYARMWIDHSSANRIWPGFEGTITYELRNDGPEPVKLRSGDRVLQLGFIQMTAPAERPYDGLYAKQNGELFSRLNVHGR